MCDCIINNISTNNNNSGNNNIGNNSFPFNKFVPYFLKFQLWLPFRNRLNSAFKLHSVIIMLHGLKLRKQEDVMHSADSLNNYAIIAEKNKIFCVYF